MKLKRQPEDFRVEELPLVEGGDRGRFGFYRLTKRGIGTMEAIEAIRRRWNLSGQQLSYGGLKDRHAVTIQYLTILGGPDQGLREGAIDLEPLGRLSHPYGPNAFRGNRFTVVLRDLTREKAGAARIALAELPNDGLPNYFDDQRFGSVGFDGDFIARAWLAGDHEKALRLAIAEPTASDRAEAKHEKSILRETWGNWAEAKARLPRSHSRSLVTYLVDHPTDFRGVFARLRRELRSIYFSAFQSHLWNLTLGRLIERTTRENQRIPVEFKVATLPIHRGLEPDQAAELSAARLPLPATRTPLPPEGPIREAALEVVAGFGLAWEDLRVKHLKDIFFSKGVRPALFFPEGLTQETSPDELYPGRFKIALGFDLPKGAYATLVVKRVTVAAGIDSSDESENEPEEAPEDSMQHSPSEPGSE
ncbi:tRNA pseudouridine(13) synthase TruD [Tundrisphaera lichenicola]|uniref:tRNA pseudouridine(13) synthase TruD n=1 Tax=Tundrisphaera lichenicola TaxID=2029860 RepID=UPI003EBBC578